MELKSIARYIRKRKKKGIFEYLFLEQTKAFWEQMERSIQILNETTPSRRGWCHGAYNHHNIIMTSSAPATIHFEHFYHGYPILDVYYFLKKALEKNNYNFAFCETFLSNYDRFMPLWIVFISGKILEDLESVYGTQKTLDFSTIYREIRGVYSQ